MFKTIYLFELKSILRQKGFVISTAIFSTIVFLLTFIPRLGSYSALSNFTSNVANKISEKGSDSKNEFAVYIADGTIDKKLFLDNTVLANSMITNSEEELKELIEREDAKKGIVIHTVDQVTVYIKKIAMYESVSPEITDIMEAYKREGLIQKYRIDKDEFLRATDLSDLNIEIKPLGKNEMAFYPIAYASLFLMYIMILTYAQFSTMAVAREKNDRTMELLITSAKPNHLILGKVLASCTSATIKTAFTIIAAILGMSLNKAYFPSGILKVLAQGFTPISFTIFFVFFITGFIMYNMLFAAAGALVDRIEDINSVIQPIVLLFVVLFLISMFSINIPNSKLTELLAMIPFSSPLVMFSSYVMRGTSLAMVGLSFALLLITTALLCLLAGRIYRLGSLSYGNKIGFIKAVRIIFSRK